MKIISHDTVAGLRLWGNVQISVIEFCESQLQYIPMYPSVLQWEMYPLCTSDAN